MSVNEAYTKTLRFSNEVDEKLSKVAQRSGRGKQQFFEQMVEYFYRTKKDPLDSTDELLQRTINKNHQNLTGFIKTQEKELLIPMRVEIDRMIGSQKKILDCFNTQILQHNQQSDRQQTDILKQINQLLQSKEQLKTKFLYLLENYARQMGTTTSGKDKEELLRKAQAQVKIL
jgi:hypothetical protein